MNDLETLAAEIAVIERVADMSEKNPTLEAWRVAIASAIGGEATDIKTVKELLECSPVGACETHGRCWTHSEWQRCGSLIQSVSSDPCQGVVDGLDGLCHGCREFKAMCEQHDEAVDEIDRAGNNRNEP